jgi:xanthine dehydrogenase accessory factor
MTEARTRPIAIVKGAGDLGTGAAYRLWKAGLRVLCVELPKPLVIRRAVAFASALYDGLITVEGVQAERILYVDEAMYVWQRGCLPVIADAEQRALDILRPEVVVDAVMAKRNTGTRLADAPVVVACGPGFTAGQDCHAVVETQRGHDLGRVLWAGGASPDTGVPGRVGGEDARRVVRSPADGAFYGRRAIGDAVKAGDVIAQVDTTLVRAELDGVLRGLLHDGVEVTAGLKVADVDPRGEPRFCFSISDKALAIGGGVLEAVFTLRNRWERA